MSDKLSTDGEIWSDESLKERSLEEQYPKLNDESDDKYKKRLNDISQWVVNANPGTTTIVENLDNPSNEYIFKKLGKLAIGYLLDLKNREPVLYQSEQTDDNMRKRGNFYLKQIERIQPDYQFIKKNQKFFLKNIPDEMDAFGHINTASDFIYGKKRKDGSFIFRDEISIAKDKEDRIRQKYKDWTPEQRETDFWSRVAEAYMYQFVSAFGLFDNPNGKRAYPIFPSKVDDLLHGVDCAFNIPVTNENDECEYIPTSLDITTATQKRDDPSGKFKKFSDWAGGQTPLHYALEVAETEDEDGMELKIFQPQQIPNFVVGIDRDIIRNLIIPDPKTNAPRKPSNNLKESIYRQLYFQCILRMKYYEHFLKSNDNILRNQLRRMKLLKNNFEKMVGDNSDNSGSPKGAAKLVRDQIQYEIEHSPF